jgi:hypothetical protein
VEIKDYLLVEVRPCIYTCLCRNKRNVKDYCESLEWPLGDSQRFLNVPRGSDDSL